MAVDMRIDLAGKWRFAIDRDDQGITDEWFNDIISEELVNLPGSMSENGKGDAPALDTQWTGRIRDTSFFTEDRYAKYREPGNIKLPFWLTPLKHYIGVAWYQREVEILPELTGRNISLHLERPHWTTDVWIDDKPVGRQISLSTPHVHHMGALSPGKRRLTIRVDNRMHVDVGEDAHSMTDHSQTNWNGIVGEIALMVSESIGIDNLQVYPAADRKSVRAVVTIANRSADESRTGRLTFQVRNVDSKEPISACEDTAVAFDNAETVIEATIPMSGDVTAWDEFHPALYELTTTLLLDGDSIKVQHHTQFGFRQFEARGRRFFLNDRHIFLRGTLECCVFPLTGYPPTGKEPWTRILRTAKAHGLNHMRFHSWCPPEAAFQAADEEGIIFSVECASWATVGFDEEYESWLYQEADHILRQYGNHPSFCMMLYGNEPYGFRASSFLAEFVNHYKARDHRRLFSSGTAWPLIPENEFQVWANPRIQYWDQNLDSRINAKPPETMTDYSDYLVQYDAPVISHEVGQWCVYPDFDEISQYTGTLRACSFEIFRDFLEASGMMDQAREFLMASGKLQVMCYKEEIESALRTPEMGGFQLLDLHDFPGQGTALVGVLNAFWNQKGYVTPDEYRRFCGPVVPLARMEKRVFINGEIFDAELLVAQFGANDIPAGKTNWKLSGAGEIEYSGELKSDVLSTGELHHLGKISQAFTNETKARKLTLEVTLPGDVARNDWDIWVYPNDLDVTPPEDVLIVSTLDSTAQEQLAAGGKVLLMPDMAQIRGDERGQVPPGFSSIFWNTAWTQGQQPHTLGILCDPTHPALAHFPTEFHSNWQWWYIIRQSCSMILNPLPTEIRPIVQVIDDWFTARRLGLVFECVMGGGKLIVSSIDLKDGRFNDPVCRQMLYSLLRYMKSANFAPSHNVTPEELERVVQPFSN